MHTKLENIHLADASQKANIALKFVDVTIRPTVVDTSHSREPHSWQLLNTSDKFGADTIRGVWSEFVNIVFCNIVLYLSSKMECDSGML